MPIKHILAPLLGTACDLSVAVSALELAQRFRAHCLVTCIGFDWASYAGMMALLPRADAEAAEAGLAGAQTQLRLKAKGAFDAAVARTGIRLAEHPPQPCGTVWWMDDPTRSGCTGPLGRLTDLVVAALPAAHDQEPRLLIDLVLGERRPALLIPPGGYSPARGAAIVWNGTAAALAALEHALAFVDSTQPLTILQIGEPGEDAISARDVGSFLGWHGFEAALLRVDQDRSGTARTLMEEAAEQGAGVIVMGAQGRSNWRDRLFGGLFPGAMADIGMPLLVAH